MIMSKSGKVSNLFKEDTKKTGKPVDWKRAAELTKGKTFKCGGKAKKK